LEGGPPSFPQGFTCLVVLRIPATRTSCPLPDSHRLWSYFPVPSGSDTRASAGPTTPLSSLSKEQRFGLLPVRSPLLRESHLISSRRATEMFQFTRFPPSLPIYSAGGLQTSLWRGCPIRILRAHRSHAAPPERFAGLRVLLRPSAPRHPPRTLASLFSSSNQFLFFVRPSVRFCWVTSACTPAFHSSRTHARALLVCARLMIVLSSFVRSHTTPLRKCCSFVRSFVRVSSASLLLSAKLK